MAINYWNRSERPASYNPLPGAVSGQTNANIEASTEYRVRFKAKSPTNAVVRVSAGANIYADITLTPEFKEYTADFIAVYSYVYVYDKNAAGNIEIKDIEIVEKPTGKTTINGVDGFGKVLPGFTGKLSAFGDFAGKVSGDLSGNPFTAKYSSFATLTAPSGFVSEANGNGALSYDRLKALDGNSFIQAFSSNGQIAQQLFTFDIIALLEKQITVNAIPYANKIAWLNDNINKISVDWFGTGSEPAGNRASLKLWYYGSSAWGATTDTHTSGAITKLNRSISSNFADTIGPGGFVHAIAYADACNGVINSMISTDYVSITVEMKQGAVVDSKWTLHPNAKVIDNETLELNATALNELTTIKDIPAEPGTYTANVLTSGTNWKVNFYDASNVRVYDSGYTGAETLSVIAPPTTKTAEVILRSLTAGKFTFKKPMLNLGGPVPYEPKRGERMVLPVPVKNLINKDTITKDMFVSSVNGGVTSSGLGNNVTDFIALEPGETYTPTNISSNGQSTTAAAFFDKNKVFVSGLSYPADGLKTFTVPTNATFARFTIKNDAVNVQLEKGVLATPYNPFRVQRARKANGVPKKNLIQGEKEQNNAIFNAGTGSGIDNVWVNGKLKVEAGSSSHNGKGLAIPVEVGKTYIFSCEASGEITTAAPGAPRILIGSGDKLSDYTTSFYPVANPNGFAFTATTNMVWVRFLINGLPTPTWPPVYFWNIQLEPGDKKTAFEYHKLQARRAVKERIVGKNLFPGFVPGYITVGVLNENPTSPDVGQVTSKWMPCEPNTAYTVSGGDRNTWHFKTATGVINASAAIPNPTTPSDAAFMRVYYSTNGSHKNIQVEKGLSATAYEPPKFAGRPARKGLEFNGISDRMQVNKDFANLSNKNFEIESVFDYNPANPGGYSQQSIVSCGDIRFGVSNVNLPQIGFYTPSSGWVAVTSTEIKTNRTRLKAVITPTNVQIFINGVLMAEKAYTGAINATPQTMLHIGVYGGTQYFFGGALHSVKMKSEGVTLFDFDFTKPARNLGTKFKDNTGIDGVIYGNPLQLNRQARR